jgi:hypothetical protein
MQMAEVNSWASRDSVSYARGGDHPPEPWAGPADRGDQEPGFANIL